MSEILNRLKQAEAERERVIADRKRLEAEADEALAQRDRDEFIAWQQVAARPVPEREAPPSRPASSRLAAGLAMAAALGVVFWLGTMVPRAGTPPRPTAPVVVAPALKPAVVLFQLDRNLEGFARKAGEKS
jgi:hypothetical protein